MDLTASRTGESLKARAPHKGGTAPSPSPAPAPAAPFASPPLYRSVGGPAAEGRNPSPEAASASASVPHPDRRRNPSPGPVCVDDSYGSDTDSSEDGEITFGRAGGAGRGLTTGRGGGATRLVQSRSSPLLVPSHSYSSSSSSKSSSSKSSKLREKADRFASRSFKGPASLRKMLGRNSPRALDTASGAWAGGGQDTVTPTSSSATQAQEVFYTPAGDQAGRRNQEASPAAPGALAPQGGQASMSAFATASATSSGSGTPLVTPRDQAEAEAEPAARGTVRLPILPAVAGAEAGSGRAFDGSSTPLLAGLASRYSPGQHMPKYSEAELKAKIDSAVMRMEREWSQKAKIAEGAQAEEHRRRFEEVRREHEASVSRIMEEHREALGDQRQAMEERLAALEEEAGEGANLEEMTAAISQLEATLKGDRARYEAELNEVKNAQGREIEEIAAELDRLEAENAEKIGNLQAELNVKDEMVNALGKSLAEAMERKERLEKDFEARQEEMGTMRVELDEGSRAIRTLKEEIYTVRSDHKKAMAEEKLRRQEACEKAQQETIHEAEVQFSAANKQYLKLKTEYAESKKMAKQLETDLTKVKLDSDKLEKNQEMMEKEYESKIRDLKATLARVEADNARSAKQYTTEITDMRERERQLEKEFEKSRVDRDAAHSSLSSIVAEKERLKKENKELNDVCEELMAMVEGQGGQP